MAKEKAKKQLEALEARIQELGSEGENLAQDVADQYRQAEELCLAIVDARRSLASKKGERANRERAEALRKVIAKIVCYFDETGKTGTGWGKRHTRLAKVVIHPTVGEPAAISVDSTATFMYSSAHSCMKRTWVGTMR